MSFMQTYDFAVVGSGLAANLFIKMLNQFSQIKIARYELAHSSQVKHSSSEKYQPYLVLNYSSIRRLQELGVNLLDYDHQKIDRYDLIDGYMKIKTITAHEMSLPFLGINISISSLVKSLSLPETSSIDSFIYDNKKLIEVNDYSGILSIKTSEFNHQTSFLAVCDGQFSNFYSCLNVASPIAYDSSQAALSVTLEYAENNIEKSAIQLFSGDYLFGIIPQPENRWTIVITAKRHLVSDLLLYSDNNIESFIIKHLPKQYHKFTGCYINRSSRNIYTYSLKQSLFTNYGFFGLSSKGMHPAGAMGFNQIIYEAALFSFLARKYGIKPSIWLESYNKLVNQKFSWVHSALNVITQKNHRGLLGLLSLELIPAKVLAPFIA